MPLYSLPCQENDFTFVAGIFNVLLLLLGLSCSQNGQRRAFMSPHYNVVPCMIIVVQAPVHSCSRATVWPFQEIEQLGPTCYIKR